MKEAVVAKGSTKAQRFVGLDVHAESIAVAVAEADGEVRSLGTIRTGRERARLVANLGAAGRARLLRSRTDGLRAVLATDGAGY